MYTGIRISIADKEKGRQQGFHTSRGGIVAEDDVWTGANSVILAGAMLGRGYTAVAVSIVRREADQFTVAVPFVH